MTKTVTNAIVADDALMEMENALSALKNGGKRVLDLSSNTMTDSIIAASDDSPDHVKNLDIDKILDELLIHYPENEGRIEIKILRLLMIMRRRGTFFKSYPEALYGDDVDAIVHQLLLTQLWMGLTPNISSVLHKNFAPNQYAQMQIADLSRSILPILNSGLRQVDKAKEIRKIVMQQPALQKQFNDAIAPALMQAPNAVIPMLVQALASRVDIVSNYVAQRIAGAEDIDRAGAEKRQLKPVILKSVAETVKSFSANIADSNKPTGLDQSPQAAVLSLAGHIDAQQNASGRSLSAVMPPAVIIDYALRSVEELPSGIAKVASKPVPGIDTVAAKVSYEAAPPLKLMQDPSGKTVAAFAGQRSVDQDRSDLVARPLDTEKRGYTPPEVAVFASRPETAIMNSADSSNHFANPAAFVIRAVDPAIKPHQQDFFYHRAESAAANDLAGVPQRPAVPPPLPAERIAWREVWEALPQNGIRGSGNQNTRPDNIATDIRKMAGLGYTQPCTCPYCTGRAQAKHQPIHVETRTIKSEVMQYAQSSAHRKSRLA